MMPPMKQKVWLATTTEELDRYGRPIVSETVKDYKARVRRKTNEIRSADGSIHNTDVEIDVPPHAPVKARQTIEYQTMEGVRETGTIQSIEDSVNLSGSRVLFKVLMVDGE